MKTYIVALPVGSIGKTVIAKHVLAAHAPRPAILSIESASPGGDEVELLSRDDERGGRILKTRLFAADGAHTTIIDAGVTDSELCAQVLTELTEVGQLPADMTIVIPFESGRKCASGLEKFAEKLPRALRRVLVYNLVRKGETGFEDLRESAAGKQVADFCASAGIELCPAPIYYSPLLDSDSPYHALLDSTGIAGVAGIDLDALREKAAKARGNVDAEARLGLALDGIGFARKAMVNLRAVYDYLDAPPEDSK
jgi:hypothetical protein